MKMNTKASRGGCPGRAATTGGIGRRPGMTLIETLIAVVILATALVGLGNFMARFSHATRISSLQQRALDLASDRIDSVKHSPTYASIDSMVTIQMVSADSATYQVQTMVQHIGGGPADTLDYKVITVAVTIPSVTTPLRKTTMIGAF